MLFYHILNTKLCSNHYRSKWCLVRWGIFCFVNKIAGVIIKSRINKKNNHDMRLERVKVLNLCPTTLHSPPRICRSSQKRCWMVESETWQSCCWHVLSVITLFVVAFRQQPAHHAHGSRSWDYKLRNVVHHISRRFATLEDQFSVLQSENKHIGRCHHQNISLIWHWTHRTRSHRNYHNWL